MDCIKLIDRNTGDSRLVPLGKSYVKASTEYILGVSKNCAGDIGDNKSDIKTIYNDIQNELGTSIGAGDVIEWLAKPVAELLNKGGCTPCMARKLAANSYSKLKKKYGGRDAAFKIIELWKSSGQNPEETILKLKEYLDAPIS